jgi:hypothetical protein
MTRTAGLLRRALPLAGLGTRRHGGRAEDVLGPGHPLARAEQREQWLGRQVAALAACLPAAGLVVLVDLATVPYGAMLAAALVASALLVMLADARVTRRERARDLVADGRETLPIASVRRERARLLEARYVQRLARSVEALRREARAPYRARPASRPLFVPAVVRAVDEELASTARILRSGPTAATVASVERLLCGSCSPLYGEDARLLRDELARVHFGGSAPITRSPDGARPAPRSSRPSQAPDPRRASAAPDTTPPRGPA